MLCELKVSLPSSAQATSVEVDELLTRAFVERTVKELISERRRRCSYFPSNLFADPAWDILLLLTLAATRDHRLNVSRICSSVDVPATTALRWITKLTSQGLLVRRQDPYDRRRKFIELSPDAYAMMAAYCSTLSQPLALAA